MCTSICCGFRTYPVSPMAPRVTRGLQPGGLTLGLFWTSWSCLQQRGFRSRHHLCGKVQERPQALQAWQTRHALSQTSPPSESECLLPIIPSPQQLNLSALQLPSYQQLNFSALQSLSHQQHNHSQLYCACKWQKCT